MRARVFHSRAAAETAQRALDELAGLPAQHEEGAADGFTIAAPGGAADRIRARGVRTEHVAEIVVHPDGTRFALVGTDDADTDLDETWAARPADEEAARR